MVVYVMSSSVRIPSLLIPLRGESFRKEFSELGDVRCLIPESVRIVAPTATATRSTRQAVVKVLKGGGTCLKSLCHFIIFVIPMQCR